MCLGKAQEDQQKLPIEVNKEGKKTFKKVQEILGRSQGIKFRRRKHELKTVKEKLLSIRAINIRKKNLPKNKFESLCLKH
jgi:hypothetical protein